MAELLEPESFQPESFEAESGLDERLLAQWQAAGFVILRKCVPESQVAAVNTLIDRLWHERKSLRLPITIDTDLESASQQRVLLRDTAEEVRQSPYKINDLYLAYDDVRAASLDPELSRVQSLLLGGAPMVCNTLNFEYGSQQADHVDSFYMPSRKENGMLASWVALDEVTENNGPVRLYPGSHLIPPYRFSNGGIRAIGLEMQACQQYLDEQVRERELEAEPFLAESGDVLIWHSQLLHGGTPILDRNMRRRSLVTHYFRKKDYRHHLWRVRKHNAGGNYYNRRHQPV